ncbi:MAG: hypothetical protein R6U19_05485, partial [Bacteroidales bacterium]
MFDWDPRFTTDAPATAKAGTVVKVKDGKTGETLEFPKDAWDAWPEEAGTGAYVDPFNLVAGTGFQGCVAAPGTVDSAVFAGFNSAVFFKAVDNFFHILAATAVADQES